ncbi:YaiO family outer membrane beta-barrel protein [Flavobacterium sp. HXWNR69]|uniref:YaiO family outer membrane beta-barrel protein n=1 Tax=Flavobacterium fragile TaxID=2949085 RepID=A0ABT0THB4_9FLAO|nr:YaiO family outer membrane beta-barrel protein [Flavobacterium sp. HXWNR69]MCL9770354.1 YaiO family outer membrane beta-barrel protein [Flavobacterium sp. HXWNR69]
MSCSIFSQEILTEKKRKEENLQFTETDSLMKMSSLNQIGLSEVQSFYSGNIEKMSTTSLFYLKKSKNLKFTFVVRVNMKLRASINSFKYDAEMYVKHGKNYYSFAGASISDKELFPNYELFYQFYSNLGRSWELETGSKFLAAQNFNLVTPIIGFTKDFEKNRISFRNFLTFTSDKMYYSNIMQWRHFLNEKRDNLLLVTGFGNAPDSRNIDLADDFIINKTIFSGLAYEKNFEKFKLTVTSVYNRNNFNTGAKFNQFDIYFNLIHSF